MEVNQANVNVKSIRGFLGEVWWTKDVFTKVTMITPAAPKEDQFPGNFPDKERMGYCPHVLWIVAPHEATVGQQFSTGLSARRWRDEMNHNCDRVFWNLLWNTVQALLSKHFRKLPIDHVKTIGNQAHGKLGCQWLHIQTAAYYFQNHRQHTLNVSC